MKNNNQLKQGMNVEREHKETYIFIKQYLKENKKLPSFEKVTKHIASDHLKERSDYYKLIKKYNL